MFFARRPRTHLRYLLSAISVFVCISAWLATQTSQATGNGCDNPSFAAPVNFATGVEHIGLAIADFNSDGKPDAVVTNPRLNTISVMMGDGLGAFGATTNFVVGAEPYAVVAADLNG